jgi:hypothetical protein
MTSEPIGVAALLESRERLLARVAHWLDAPSCAFLESVEDEQPDFGLIGLPMRPSCRVCDASFTTWRSARRPSVRQIVSSLTKRWRGSPGPDDEGD